MRKKLVSFIIFFSILDTLTSQTVTATQTDSLVGDHQTIGIANPNDTVRYKTTISVSGATANGVNFSNTIPTNTTQVGTVKTSALCRDDVFATSFNTLINSGNVLTNDYGLPNVSVVSFGTTMSGGTTTMAGNAGTTNGGGSLTVNANGTFSYQPMTGFSGMDQFTYIGTTGVAGLQNGIGIVTINVATDITFTTIDVNPLCNGASTGSIMFMASGGTGSLMYSITGAMGSYQASPSFAGLSAGTYNLAVKDAANYIKTGTTTLTDPALITFTTMNVDNVCNGDMTGSITFNASGGTGALTYSITGSMGSYQMSSAFTGLAANTYNLAVKDANNCIVTGTTSITQPTAVTFTFTKTDITCNGAGNGSIVFNTTMGGTAPYTYSITGTMGTFTGMTNYTGLSANTYNLVAKDNLGCNSVVQSTTVLEPAAIVVSGTIPNLTYNIGSNVTFTKTGGTGSPTNPWSGSGFPTGVSINSSSGVVSGIPTQTGMFTATIIYTDANGCTDDIMVSFNVAPRLLNESFAVVGNTQLVSNGHSTPTTPHTTSTTNILTNDQSDAAITVTAGTFATVNGGSITIGTDGKFIFSPLAGSTASDSYVYTGTSNGVSATATITFNISNMVWYVNNTFVGSSDGRSQAPFTTCNAAATASAINQTIYIHTGTGNTAGNTVLKSGQTLRGAGNALSIGALTIPSGTKPTLSNTITLANSVIVDGFDMSTGLGVTALSSSGATSVNVNIANVSTTNPNNSVTLTNTTGSISIAGGGLIGGGGATINIDGGSVSFTYGGNINQGTSNHPMVNIAGGHTGTVTFNTGTLTATNGTGLQFDNADGTYNIFGTCTLNGGDAGVDILNGSSGSFAFTNTNITNPSGVGFYVNNSTPSNISCNGSISKNNAGRLIDISSNSGGTMTFNNTLSSTGTSSGILVNSNSGVNISFAGTTKTLNTGANTAVSFTGNAGTTANFSGGGLDIDVTSATGFNATGGGTINVTGNGNSITSTTGTALNVSGTTIGSSNLNFQSISSNGGTETGIILNNTGSSGGLIVTGNGTPSSGGSIMNKSGTDGNLATGCGIYLNNTSNVSLSYMQLNDFQNFGIYGLTVNNFSLLNSNVQSLASGTSKNGTSDAENEGSVNFGLINVTNGLTGIVNIDNCIIEDGFEDNFNVFNLSGTLSQITMTSTTIRDNSTASPGNNGLQLHASGTASITADITNCTFTNNRANGIQAITEGSAIVNVEIGTSTANSGGTFTNNNIGINLAHNSSGTFHFNVKNGSFTNNTGSGSSQININRAAGVGAVARGLFMGNVLNNIINMGNSSTGPGLRIIANGCGDLGGASNTMTIRVDGNNVSNVGNYGIHILTRDGNGIINAIVTNNVASTTNPLGLQAIRMDAGATSTNVCGVSDNGVINAHIAGNTASSAASMVNGIRVRQRFNTTYRLQGYAGGATDMTAVQNFLTGLNTATVDADYNTSGGTGFQNIVSVPAPTN